MLLLSLSLSLSLFLSRFFAGTCISRLCPCHNPRKSIFSRTADSTSITDYYREDGRGMVKRLPERKKRTPRIETSLALLLHLVIFNEFCCRDTWFTGVG